MHMTVACLRDEELARPEAMPGILRKLSADGLLIDYTDSFPARMPELVEAYRIPSVWVNTKLPADCVHPDDSAAFHDATVRLITLGHRRIAYADYAHGSADLATAHYSARDRLAGYEQAVREAGLPPRHICGEHFVPDAEQLAFTERWLRAPDRPTAVVTYAATPVIIWAADRLGIRVGPDLAMVCAQEWRRAVLGVSVASVLLHWAEVGRAAVEMLGERIEDPSRQMGARAIPCAFWEGQTALPPAGV